LEIIVNDRGSALSFSWEADEALMAMWREIEENGVYDELIRRAENLHVAC